MFIWLNVLLSVVFLPISLFFGRPQKIMFCKNVVDEKTRNVFPVSSLTPFIDFVPWGWMQKLMAKRGIEAVTCLCYVYFRPWKQRETLEFHEAVHVMQQSAVSPILVGLAYLLDMIVFWQWRSWFHKSEMLRVSTVERVAYRVTGQEEANAMWLEGQD